MIEEILERYEPVIGLEVHTHLATESKLFSPAPVRVRQCLPNHDVHPSSISGLPGVLPVLERARPRTRHSPWASRSTRPSTCRSDLCPEELLLPGPSEGLPDFSISRTPSSVTDGSRFACPWRAGFGRGRVRDAGVRRIGITRAHLEEDAGKSIHDDAVTRRDGEPTSISIVPGVPLTGNCLRTRTAIRQRKPGRICGPCALILRHIGVSPRPTWKRGSSAAMRMSLLRPVGVRSPLERARS